MEKHKLFVVSALLIVPALLELNPAFSASSAVPISPAGSQKSGAAPDATAQEVLSRSSTAFNDIAQKAIPAVVSINVIKRVDPKSAHAGLGLPFGGPSGPGEPDDLDPMTPHEQRSVGIGSGVIIRPDGYILTNHHVIENAERVTVTLDEKHKRSAKVVGEDPKTDLAVIKMDPDVHDSGKSGQLQTLRFGNSEDLKVGDWVMAIGSPFGLSRSVSSGIVSAKGRGKMGILDTEDFIQTDAAINPGSSGGPLLNSSGEMIGLNTAIYSQGGGFAGIGFAIPSKIAQDVAKQLIENGHVTRGWIGVAAQDLDEGLSRHFKVAEGQGALVSDVTSEGPASRAGLNPGDVITKINDQPVDSAGQLKNSVGKAEAGSTAVLDVIRNGHHKKLKVGVQEQPRPKAQLTQMAGQAARSSSPPNFGLTVEDLPQEIARFLHISSRLGALVTEVKAGSPAFDSGITPGDIILKLDQAEVRGAKQFQQLMKKSESKDGTVLYVQRGPDEKIYVSLQSDESDST